MAITVSPAAIYFGAISNDTVVSVEITNDDLVSAVSLDSITYDASLGLVVAGAALPLSIPADSSVTFSVVATAAGPESFDDAIVWEFDLPFTLNMPVSGRRSRVPELKPAWPPSGRSYEVSYEFSTFIKTSWAGREQRIAKRGSPRKNLSFTAFKARDQFRAFRETLRHWQHKEHILPEETRSVLATTGMLTDEDTLIFDAVPDWAVTGSLVILQSGSQRKLMEVLAVTATDIQFVDPAGEDWPAGTRVYYAVAGFLRADTRLDMQTSAVARFQVDLAVRPWSEPDFDYGVAPQTYNGRELFTKKPNWGQSVTATARHEIEELDYGQGPIYREAPVEFPGELRQATYLNRNPDEAEALLALFCRMKGRQGEFYAPTWEYDIKPKAEALSGTDTLRVEGGEFADIYSGSTVYRHLFVLYRDGTLDLRGVTAITQVDVGGSFDTEITVDTAWSQNTSQASIRMMGWLPVWRFYSDTLVMEWLTSRVANAQLTIMTLEDLAVETP